MKKLTLICALMCLTTFSYAKEKKVEFDNQTNLSNETAENIAYMGKSLGVKEPIILVQQGNSVILSNTNDSTQCTVKIANEQPNGISCK